MMHLVSLLIVLNQINFSHPNHTKNFIESLQQNTIIKSTRQENQNLVTMSQQVFLQYLRSFSLTFNQKTVDAMKKLLDPFNFKYKRPFNILSPEDNPPEYQKSTLTPRVLQLSLVKLSLELMDQKLSKTYMFGTFCDFLSENLPQIVDLVKKQKKDSTLMKMVIFILSKMAKQWCAKGYNLQVIRNQNNLQQIVSTIKSFLQWYVNKEFIKNESEKLGLNSLAKNINVVSPQDNNVLSASNTPLKQASKLSQPLSRVSLQPQNETSLLEITIEFTSPYTSQELYLSAYSLLLFFYYYNDQSIALRQSQVPMRKQFQFSSLIKDKSQLNDSQIVDHQEEESIYFMKDNFLSLLSQSLEILFYLSTGGKELGMMSEMFILCSNLLVFRTNPQKPTLLRLVLYEEKQMHKKEWPEMCFEIQQQTRYEQLLKNYLMLDPQFRHKLLGLIEQWMSLGVELMNSGLMLHWKVLIETVNKRIFQSSLQGEMFNLLISKSQGNKHCRLHVGILLSEMIDHISTEVIVKNSEQIFCLEDFIDEKKVKLLEIYFECAKNVIEKKKNFSNKTILNRIVSLYLQLKDQTQIQQQQFVEFFKMLIANSVESGERLLSQKNLKSIHIPVDTIPPLFATSQRSLSNSRKFINEIDAFMTRTNNFSSQYIFSNKLIDEIDESQLEDVEDVEITMLRQLLEERKKGQSYFLKFIKDINKNYFTHQNVKVYEIYADYLLNKLTDFSVTVPEFNRPLNMTSTPQTFLKYYNLYETLFNITNQNKVLSVKLYKCLFLLETVTETNKLSNRHHWFIRKLKYFFTSFQQQSSIRSRIISVGNESMSRLDIQMQSSQRSGIQAPQSKVQQSDKVRQSLFDFIKSIYLKLKNKITFVTLISMFCLRYCQTHRKIINLEKRQQNKRKSNTENQLAIQLSEISQFLQTNKYALISSTCSIATFNLMVLYNLVLMNDYMTHSRFKGNVSQSGGKIKEFETVDFKQIDQNPLLIQIRKIIVLMMDCFTPYQINEFLYMFTMKQSCGEKLIAYMGLPPFESIPLIARLQPILKIVREITTRKYETLEKRQVIFPFYNHIEVSFMDIPENEYSMLKKDEKTYIINLQLLINWSVRCDNFISFWTEQGKYKLIIKQKMLSLLYRKEGSNQTEKVKDYEIRTEIGQRVIMQIVVKSKQMGVYLQKKKLIATINCDTEIKGVKLQMINGLLVEKVSVAKNSPDIEFYSRPQLQEVNFQSCFLPMPDSELQLKLKDLSIVDVQAAEMTFPYEKYFFLMKKICKVNRELIQNQPFQFLSHIFCETFLKMIKNKNITLPSFNSTNSLFPIQTNQTKRQSVKVLNSAVKPQNMWKLLIKLLIEEFIQNKTTAVSKRRVQGSVNKLIRKSSENPALMKLALKRSNSTQTKPQFQQEEFFTSNQPSSSFISVNHSIQIPTLPLLGKQPKIISTDGFMCFIIEVVLKKQMWDYWSEKGRLEMSIFLKQLLQNKQFLLQVENETFDVFYHLLNVLEKVTHTESSTQNHTHETSIIHEKSESHNSCSSMFSESVIFTNLSESIRQLLLSHQLNQLLKEKFKYMFFLSETGKSKLIKQLFLQICDKLSIHLVTKDSVMNKMSTWVMIDSEKFEYVFGTCRQQTRVRILDYLSQLQLQTNQNQLANFMQKLSIEALYEVRTWMMIYIKKILFKLKMKQNVLKLMKQLGQLTTLLVKIFEEIKDKSDKDELLKIVQQAVTYMKKRQQDKQLISKQLEALLSNEHFVKYFQSLVSENVLIPSQNNFCLITKFCAIITGAVFSLQKTQLLKALTMYRRVANKTIPLLVYPLKLQVVRKLTPYKLSCFLQYILQATLSVENCIGGQQKAYFVLCIKSYLEWLLRSYDSQKQQVPGVLVYVYPKIFHIFNCQSAKQLALKLKTVQQAQLLELRGGIYFKLIVIILHLLQMKPDQDLTPLLEVLLFKPIDQKDLKDQKQLYAAFRAMNDFSQVQSLSRQRSLAQKIMSQLSPLHKSYSNQHDKPLQPLQVISNKLVKFQQQNDLTTYFIDYLLMRIVQYLTDSPIIQDKTVTEIQQKYALLVVKVLEKFPLIQNDLLQKNIYSPIPLYDYPTLVMLLIPEDNQLSSGQKFLISPQSKYDIDPQTPTTPQKDYIDESYFEKIHTQTPSKSIKNIQFYDNERFSKTAGKRDDLFLNVNPAPERSKRKKSFNPFLLNENSKFKDQMTFLIKKDYQKWLSQCKDKKFSRFFRDQAKQLYIMELMFTYYVQNTVLKPSNSTQKQVRMMQKYFQRIEEEIENYEQKLSRKQWTSKQLIRMFNVKRLSPYFLQSSPILKVKACGFPNMCMPIMTQIPKPSYRLRERDMSLNQAYLQSLLIDEQQFRMDMFGIDNHHDDIQQSGTGQDAILLKDELQNELDLSYNMGATPKKSFFSGSQKSLKQKSYICLQQSDWDDNDQNKKKEINYCQLVTRKGVYFCQWNIELKKLNKPSLSDQKKSAKRKAQPILVLETFKQKPLECPRYLKYGSPVSNLLSHEKTIEIPLKLIREIFFRKYNQIRNNSIELFCSDGRQHFICLYSDDRAEELIKAIQQHTKSIIKIKIIRNPQKDFETRQYTNKWINGEIDNFTYLMLVNKYSGRSFCDTNQYPVFPWVVSDYKSAQLDLNDIKTYRDLTKPIGALNDKKLQKYYEKYHLQNQDTGIFLYGSHFSTSLFIYYFLVRMEPFSSLHQQMQGGSWDAPDRLFSSLDHMWDSLTSASATTDIKQSIPEFYYFPFFLKNTNHIDLGIRQSGQPVNDVLLPPWAKSPEDFVFKLRLAFQSNYVSLNLPYWIDLIFGIDQKNIKRHNLFHPLSYSQNIHIDKIPQKDLQARICQISYFGQFPIKLFTKPHKLKKLAINKIFSRDLLTPGFIRLGSGGKKQTDDLMTITLPAIYSIASIQRKVRSESNSSCILKVKNNQLNTQFQVQLDPKQDNVQSIIKKLSSLSKQSQKQNRKRQVSFYGKERPQSSLKKHFDPFYIGFSQPRTCTIMSRVTPNRLTFYSVSNPNLILASYWFDARYKSHLYNQSFVILYGEDGLTILNWNFEEIFSFNKRAVDSCFVDQFLVFIASKDGKVYIYDMVAKSLTPLIDLSLAEEQAKKKQKQQKAQKQIKTDKQKQKQKQKEPKNQKIYKTKMEVFFDKKLILASNQEQYKIVIVANDNKICLLNYRHLKKNWVNVNKQ